MINLKTTIFNKPLDQVTFSDVETFCEQQIGEGPNLDYKKDLSSKKLLKTIASFANTRGGWIIVGVDDQDSKPVLPAKGLLFSREMSLTITNMVLSNMSPPCIPICHVCPKNVDGNTFMIIYVPESPDAPHWIFNKRELYIRVSQRSDSGDWERFATSDEWEWLRNKREKTQELRSSIKRDIDNLFLDYYWREELAKTVKTQDIIISRGGRMNRPETKNMLNLYISPFYPSDVLFDVNETFEILEEAAVLDYYGTDHRFPTCLNDRTVFVGGTNIFGMFDDDYCHSAALHINGMFSTKETVVNSEKTQENSLSFSIDFGRIAARLDQFLRVADSIYKSAGFEGMLYWEIYIDGKNWMKIKFPSIRFTSRTNYLCPTGEYYWNDNFTSRDLATEESRYKIIQDSIKSLMQTFGYKDFPLNVLKDFYKNNSQFTEIP